MTHLDHDLDLIGAHASGDLADREQAEALLRSCPECAAEHREQVAIKQLLGKVPAAQLTNTEAEALHRDVISQLPAPVVDLAAARARKPLSPVWGRLTGVAALLAGVVVVGTVFATGGGDSAATTTTGFQFAAGESSADRIAGTETTAATGSTFGGAAGQNTEDAATLSGDEDSLDSLGTMARTLLEEQRNEAAPTATTSTADLSYQESCPELAELTVLTTAEATLNDRPVTILIVEGETEPTARAFYTDDCSEIDLPVSPAGGGNP